MTSISYALEGSVAVVTMDDGKANALTATTLDALTEALTRAEQEAAALVIVGRPERFSGGFDLKTMMASYESATALLRRGSELFMRLYDCKIPLVMACTGHAIAGGALMLLSGDVRVGASGDFRIGLNEVAIGMPVPVLFMEFARARLDGRELTKATLFAKLYGPEEAARVGYLDDVVAPGDVLAKAKEHAMSLTKLSKGAYYATKTRLRGQTLAYVRSTLEADLATLLVRS